MMTAQTYRGLFFTSPPKAGKNLVYSCLAVFRYQRFGRGRVAGVKLAERPWLEAAGKRCTYALPPDADPEGVESRQFLGQVAANVPRGHVLHHHFPYQAELAGLVTNVGQGAILLVRDPRDILISMADYIMQQGKPEHLARRWPGASRTALVESLWHGDETLLDFDSYLRGFLDWRLQPGVLVLRFEELVGPAGGGTLATQQAAVQSLAALLGVQDQGLVEQARQATFNTRAGTFYKGMGGRWRLETEPRVRAILGDPAIMALVAAFGYPP